MIDITNIIGPWKQRGIDFYRNNLITNISVCCVYPYKSGNVSTWVIFGKVNSFPTKEKAIAYADKLLIDEGYILINDQETLDKYLLLL